MLVEKSNETLLLVSLMRSRPWSEKVSRNMPQAYKHERSGATMPGRRVHPLIRFSRKACSLPSVLDLHGIIYDSFVLCISQELFSRPSRTSINQMLQLLMRELLHPPRCQRRTLEGALRPIQYDAAGTIGYITPRIDSAVLGSRKLSDGREQSGQLDSARGLHIILAICCGFAGKNKVCSSSSCRDNRCDVGCHYCLGITAMPAVASATDSTGPNTNQEPGI